MISALLVTILPVTLVTPATKLPVSSVAGQEWSAHRGGPARTGNVDGKAGPTRSKVLWVHRTREHFIAPPVPAGDRLLVCVLGAFNTGGLSAFDLAEAKPLWSRRAPIIRFPTVGAPAAAGGMVVIGEGMHQTDGTSLHALRANDGRGLWRLTVPGELVHIEASPSIAGGRVYVGAGAAGVLCVDPTRVTLEGRERTPAEAAAEVDRRWKELLEKYEAEKKRDAEFAIPPNEGALPCPAPALAWQKGNGAWHVDAPVLVARDRVWVVSAFLEKERLGERALICLNAADGAEIWKAPMGMNGWGGATLAGELLLVPTCSIRYDPKELASARGEILAVRASDGGVAWRRDAGAAVLGTIAAAGELAVFCDTAGRVRALDVRTGEPRWAYAGGAPFFAGAAVAGDAAYTADLEGVVHAVGLSDGRLRWKLALGADPAVAAPGMVYGSPVVHGGRVYVATCNMEGKSAGGETVIVCIGQGE